MRILWAMAIGVMLVGLLSGCFTAPVVPPTGLVYAGYKAPLDTDADASEMGLRGQSQSHCILWLVAWGDASVKSAADEAGLTTVNHVDYEFFHILGVYQRYRTVVYGQ